MSSIIGCCRKRAALALFVFTFVTSGCGLPPGEDFGQGDTARHALSDTPPALNDPGWSTTEELMNTLGARGLYTSPSQIGSAPPGAMVRADNARIRRAGVVENRRGEEVLSPMADTSPVDAMTTWRGVVVAHRANGKLARFSGGVWTDYTGTYLPPSNGAIRFVESAGDLLFTTSAGVYRLDDVEGTPLLAGVPAALQMSAALSGSSGFLPGYSAVAYRIVWGTRSASDRLLLGAPSSRVVAYNTLDPETAGTSRNVALTVPLPAGVTADHFFQVYRSETLSNGTSFIPSPSDEMALVYENYPTAAELTAGMLTFTDIAPEPMGANLYSNPNSGNGILSQKDRPPLAKVVGSFKGFAFYGDIQKAESLELTLLAVGGTGGLKVGESLEFDRWANGFPSSGAFHQYRAGPVENQSINEFKLYTDGTPAQNIANTAQSIVRIVNGDTGGSLTATYTGDDNSTPGRIRFEARSAADGQYFARIQGASPAWAPALRARFHCGLVRAGGVVTATVSTTDGLAVGQQVYISAWDPLDEANFPPGVLHTITSIPDATHFTYADSGPDASTGVRTMEFQTTIQHTVTTPLKQAHGFAWSDFNGPDAVPPSQYDVLPTNEQTRILWGYEVGSSFIIGTTAGLFKVYGSDPSNFTIDPLDPSYIGTSGALAAPIAGKVLADSNRGVLLIGENSVAPVPVSAPIDNDYAKVKADTGSTFYQRGFFMPYPAESEVEVWLPSASSDTHATQAYVFNMLTGAWTRDTNTATSATVGPDGKRYFGQPAGGVWRERKAGNASDYFRADGVSGIPLHVTYVGQNGGDATQWKFWTEIYFHLQTGAPTQARYEIYTDYIATPYSHALLGTGGAKPGTVWSQPDQSHVRCRTMFVGFKHTFPGERVELTGYGVKFRRYGASGGSGGDMTE